MPCRDFRVDVVRRYLARPAWYTREQVKARFPISSKLISSRRSHGRGGASHTQACPMAPPQISAIMWSPPLAIVSNTEADFPRDRFRQVWPRAGAPPCHKLRNPRAGLYFVGTSAANSFGQCFGSSTEPSLPRAGDEAYRTGDLGRFVCLQHQVAHKSWHRGFASMTAIDELLLGNQFTSRSLTVAKDDACSPDRRLHRTVPRLPVSVESAQQAISLPPRLAFACFSSRCPTTSEVSASSAYGPLRRRMRGDSPSNIFLCQTGSAKRHFSIPDTPWRLHALCSVRHRFGDAIREWLPRLILHSTHFCLALRSLAVDTWSARRFAISS